MSIQIQMLKTNGLTIEFEKMNNFEKKLVIALSNVFRKYGETIDKVKKSAHLYFESENEIYQYHFETKFENALKELQINPNDIELKITHSTKDMISGFILYDKYIYQFRIIGDIYSNNPANKFTIHLTKYKYQYELKAYNE